MILRGFICTSVLIAVACSPTGATSDSGTVADSGLGAPPDAGRFDAGRDDAGGPHIGDAGRVDAGGVDAGTAQFDAGHGSFDAGMVAVVDAGGSTSCVTPTVAADVDPWSVRLPSVGFGGTLLDNPGSHHDVYLKSPAPMADYTRIGVRLDWGGTVVFWGLGANPASNTIDANDTGRELQVALYDPHRNRQSCAFDASCLTSTSNCGNSITYLGWNPVQGGDECNRGSQATWSVVGDALRVIVNPVQWNPDWDAMDCRSTACGGPAREGQVRYLMDLRFVDPLLVEVSLEVQSQEVIDHELTTQEFPTLYVSHGSPDLAHLLNSSGQKIEIDQPANDGFTVKNFTSPKPWVAFQDTGHTYGVGLAMDQGITDYQGWAGDGRSTALFHNVRANISFGLKHQAIVRGRSYLALGNFDTIAATMAGHLAKRPPFGVLDSPAAGVTAHAAAVQISGWALDTDHLDSVRVEVDGVAVKSLPVTSARPDVCEIYPMYSGCPAVGFSEVIAVVLSDDCAHVLRVVAVDGDGNRTVLGERLVVR